MSSYKRIRDLREDADYTQKQVADMLFMHLTQYRRYENGESELPMNIAVSIARLYNVSLDYIAGINQNKRGLTESTLNEDEKNLINGFRSLKELDKGRLLERLEMLLKPH